ncbi:ribose 5-phosphate isomerase A [Phyllobacterium endophyticum]|uniref:Ribose-5-phosphate isomerase A n=1 Tax=Phyllobacterium endophyticum TaxID=1149773 RepID=A0A2P7AKH4_9HYPH|nr:ribose 5-phosphate isomerase A [Phyllobacterium endophyticum]MBB3237044.1 ribose 5-phosphate isomerase A [Phyllobacterium endophyticum]PSH54706.1 ribose 5-phosphate isomerase A [Phyllobacterium endophyticum]TYR40527.1 ribose 5-phosphate isomerase A [Phyllobacterium endophyticum]
MSDRQNEAKKIAGRRVIQEFVRDGMKLGLGSGTTSHFFVRELGKYVADGMKLTCTTTSRSTIDVAREVGIAITDPNDIGELDLTVDGPDEIDRRFNMIKGGGACLLWEKIIAHASRQMITVCDETKIVDHLGAFPLPVEVVQFAWKQTERMVANAISEHGITADIYRRMRDGQPVVTDSGNFILDCKCGVITDPAPLEIELNRIPGVVENGLFTRESSGMVVGCFDGSSYVTMRNM